MSIMERLANIDRRVICAVLFLVVSIPLIRPIGIPLSVNPWTRDVYDFIEKLEPGSRVIVSVDAGPAALGELGPGCVALLNHLAQKNLKVYVVSFDQAGPNLFEMLVTRSILANEPYGEKWVNLGYLAGGSAALAAMAQDIPGTYPKDFRGTPTSSIPMMREVKTIKDTSMVAVVASSTALYWVQVIGDPMKFPVAIFPNTVDATNLAPYVQSGQLVGLVAGLRGGAEYELLTKVLGVGAAGMDAQSMAHLLVLGLILLGNIGYFLAKSKGGQGVTGHGN